MHYQRITEIKFLNTIECKFKMKHHITPELCLQEGKKKKKKTFNMKLQYEKKTLFYHMHYQRIKDIKISKHNRV